MEVHTCRYSQNRSKYDCSWQRWPLSSPGVPWYLLRKSARLPKPNSLRSQVKRDLGVHPHAGDVLANAVVTADVHRRQQQRPRQVDLSKVPAVLSKIRRMTKLKLRITR